MKGVDRDIDLIVYGATGFTGGLVARHLVERFGSDPASPRWALAGRSLEKLQAVKQHLGCPDGVPLIVADSADDASMREMCLRAKVVITTVGPYQLYGNALVQACAATGTDYVDLCGEPIWMSRKIDELESVARASGARIVFSCGFDSIPFELGVFLAQKEFKARFGHPAPRLRARLRRMKGRFSNGTLASLNATHLAASGDSAQEAAYDDPFLLSPGFAGPAQPVGRLAVLEEDINSWTAPFVMTPINTKNVHRSNALLDHAYGTDFVYDEMMMTGAGEEGRRRAERIVEASAGQLARSESDPVEEERKAGFYDILFIAEAGPAERLAYVVRSDEDPGYDSTSRMIAETALALLDLDKRGGVWTPAALLQERLAERLSAHAFITFRPEAV